ncbi:hypothetical protein NQ315_004707 [Exocentrus adspersus]|uniref:Uncharacterized protein n=1 Tax=Exocentrus adspersus TaxID=1586481 RepID=A0AAV8W272_9CUCU|nr:hypothetical protein NQ315_004707 [Exocentrus adspersus]
MKNELVAVNLTLEKILYSNVILRDGLQNNLKVILRMPVYYVVCSKNLEEEIVDWRIRAIIQILRWKHLEKLNTAVYLFLDGFSTTKKSYYDPKKLPKSGIIAPLASFNDHWIISEVTESCLENRLANVKTINHSTVQTFKMRLQPSDAHLLVLVGVGDFNDSESPRPCSVRKPCYAMLKMEEEFELKLPKVPSEDFKQVQFNMTNIFVKPNVGVAEVDLADPEYEQFLADVWVGIVLTLMVLSCVCFMCSCLIYHKFQQWKSRELIAKNFKYTWLEHELKTTSCKNYFTAGKKGHFDNISQLFMRENESTYIKNLRMYIYINFLTNVPWYIQGVWYFKPRVSDITPTKVLEKNFRVNVLKRQHHQTVSLRHNNVKFRGHQTKNFIDCTIRLSIVSSMEMNAYKDHRFRIQQGRHPKSLFFSSYYESHRHLVEVLSKGGIKLCRLRQVSTALATANCIVLVHEMNAMESSCLDLFYSVIPKSI